MKKIVSILLCAMMVAALAVSVMAAPGKDSYGTVPLYKGGVTVDGKIDPAYTKLGLKIELAGDFPGYASDGTGVAYMLHDGETLYVVCAIKNSHPFAAPTEKISKSNGYKETGIEFFIDYTGEGKTPVRWFSWPDGQYLRYDDATPDLKGYAGTMDIANQSYIQEYAIPLTNGAKTGSTMGWYVMVDSHPEIGVLAQKHIVVPTNMDGVSASNKPAEWCNITLGSTEVKMTAEKPATTTTTSPATFDVATVLCVVAAVSGAGVIVSKKKH